YLAPQRRTPRPRGSPSGVDELSTARPAIVARARAADGAGDSGSALFVNVRKNYPGFELSAAFSTGRGPLGILGASGSGKSMTIRCIAGLARPQAGRVVLNGRVLLDTGSGIDLPPAERRIGIVFQDYALFPHLTVERNIGFGLHGQTEEQR